MRERAAGFVADLGIRIRMHHRRETSNNRTLELARPCRLAGRTAQGVCRIAANAGHGIIQHRYNSLDGSVIGTVIEQLDAPPAHLWIRVREPVDQGLKRRLGDADGAELACVHATDQRSCGLDASRRNCQRLDPLALLAHAEHRTIPSCSEQAEFGT